jgi:release factor glutamine methyltransferase
MEALKWANQELKSPELDSSNIDKINSSMLDAQVLLAHSLNVSKSWLFTHFDKNIEIEKIENFQNLISRRKRSEPIAYIIGSKSFYKRDFYVNSFVLIPRPCTEMLVEEALDIVEDQNSGSTLFVDAGTGSGSIAITLAAESGLPVIATDISMQALSIARKNAEKHDVTDIIDFRQGDILNPVISLIKKIKSGNNLPFDQIIICANLPYLTTEQMDVIEKEVSQYEPRSALEAGPDGLNFYWKLFRDIAKNRDILTDNLSVLIEIDPSQTDSIKNIITHSFPFADYNVKKDLEGKNRLAIIKTKNGRL